MCQNGDAERPISLVQKFECFHLLSVFATGVHTVPPCTTIGTMFGELASAEYKVVKNDSCAGQPAMSNVMSTCPVKEHCYTVGTIFTRCKV